MPATLPILLGERSVTVRELTVGEVRDWLVETEAGSNDDPIQALALEECGLADLSRMSDIDADALEGFAPSELAPIVAACKKLNPHFFRVRAALSGVARLMLQEAAALASTEAPAPL